MKELSRLRISNPVFQAIKTHLFVKKMPCINATQVASIKYFPPPPEFGEIEWPKERRLAVVPKVPTSTTNTKPRKMKRQLSLMRGPEPLHNFLIYKQYGLQAITGGRMEARHFEFLRNALRLKFDYSKAFALWRVDPPWQPVSRKGSGKRMGGGKAQIHRYVSPVKAGRIILEFGGTIHPLEVRKKLAPLAENLPFPARFVTQEMLEEEAKNKKWKEENNLNPYTFKYVILNNMGGCSKWLSPYDYKWFGEYK